MTPHFAFEMYAGIGFSGLLAGCRFSADWSVFPERIGAFHSAAKPGVRPGCVIFFNTGYLRAAGLRAALDLTMKHP